MSLRLVGEGVEELLLEGCASGGVGDGAVADVDGDVVDAGEFA